MAVGSSNLTVVTSEPFDKDLVGKIAQNLGEITLYTAGIALDEPSPKPDQNAVSTNSGVSYSSEKNKSEIVVTPDNKGKKKEVLGPDFTVGTTPNRLVVSIARSRLELR